MMACEQLSFFCRHEATATNLLFGNEYNAVPPTQRMIDLVPKGEYVVYIEKNTPCVLCPVGIGREEVPEGHAFYHFLIDGQVYAGIFIGKDDAESEGMEENEWD